MPLSRPETNPTQTEIITGLPADAVITFGPAAINPPTTQEEEYIRLDNPNTFDVDVSQWTVEGEITWTLKPGTVIEAGGSLFLTPNAAAFRARHDAR